MDQNQDFTLGQQIAELRGEVTSGFKGVFGRLDTLNGKVADHEKRLNEGAIKKAYDDGKNAGANMTWGKIIAIATLIGGAASGLFEIFRTIFK